MPLSCHLQLTFYKKTLISYLSLHQSVAFMNHWVNAPWSLTIVLLLSGWLCTVYTIIYYKASPYPNALVKRANPNAS